MDGEEVEATGGVIWPSSISTVRMTPNQIRSKPNAFTTGSSTGRVM